MSGNLKLRMEPVAGFYRTHEKGTVSAIVRPDSEMPTDEDGFRADVKHLALLN